MKKFPAVNKLPTSA